MGKKCVAKTGRISNSQNSEYEAAECSRVSAVDFPGVREGGGGPIVAAAWGDE